MTTGPPRRRTPSSADRGVGGVSASGLDPRFSLSTGYTGSNLSKVGVRLERGRRSRYAWLRQAIMTLQTPISRRGALKATLAAASLSQAFAQQGSRRTTVLFLL